MARLSNAAYNEHKDRAFFAALRTGDPGPLAWAGGAGHTWPNRGGSENIAAEVAALRLFRPETRERGLASWASWVERSPTGFEGIEPGSRIYRSRTLAAHLLAFRWALREGHAEMLAFLRDWLRLYWTLELLGAVDRPHGPQSLRVGARSAGHPLHPIQSDFALAMATGKPFKFTKPWKFLGPQNREAEGNLARQLKLLQPEIDRSSLAVRNASLESRLRDAAPWGTLAPAHYYRTARGVAVWVDQQEGGNTVGISAMGCDAGGEPWCIGPSPQVSAGNERRWRQKAYHLRCRLDGSVLRAGGDVAGGPIAEEEHPLPAGEPIYHVIHDAGGLRRA